MRVKCKSGLWGWQCKLRENYANFQEWEGCSEMYGLAKRIGYRSAKKLGKAILQFKAPSCRKTSKESLRNGKQNT